MLSNQRKKFSLPANSIYLNCSYMSPLMKEVEKAGVEGMKRKRNPATISPANFFDQTEILRDEYAKLINVKESKRIVVIPSVSYGLANVAKNLKADQSHNIVVAGEQFPSNVYPWMKIQQEKKIQLKTIAAPSILKDRGKIWNERILDAIDSNTKMVALGNVHWADGTKFDLIEIRKRTRDVGALLVIDGSQSVGALAFDISQIQPDALICVGYKWMLGPYSIGLAYYGDYFDGGAPVEENWMNRKFSEDFAALVLYQENYQSTALRYEVGEHSNFILVPMMLTALKQINKWKPENIQQYCAKITRKPIERLREAGFWVEDENYRGHHLFGIRLPKNTDMEKIKQQLQKNKISVSVRGDAIRVSPNLYNTENDLMKLVRTLTT
ncbi:MAG: aminotransferase class V-fold PLP-dependent enzyme [Bacteroidetes bacterium]|nr:aminotransferase class V-fold PLP-dependent enzyme [Bacteroidota bacterium]MBI3483219.1 aminotransferase class V-fold PLP-dependent enzyme [Bacteroidota bacterium]